MAEAFVYDHIRTPRGRGKAVGSLHEVKPVDLVVGLLDELRTRNPDLDPSRVDDVVLGVVTPIGDQGGDIAKTAALKAGYPDTVAGVQLNRFCASGLEAVNQAAQRVRSGFEDLMLAGGVESMSRVPMGSDGGAWAMDPATALQTGFVPQGIGADLIATIEGWSRQDVDAYAAESTTAPRRPGPTATSTPRSCRSRTSTASPCSTATRPSDPTPPSRGWPASSRRSPGSARTPASTTSRWRSTTGSPRSTTSTTPATPRASSTAPR